MAWNAQKMKKKKKWYTPFYQSAQISKLLNFLQVLKQILRAFSFQGGTIRGGRGLDHFASEPFIIVHPELLAKSPWSGMKMLDFNVLVELCLSFLY